MRMNVVFPLFVIVCALTMWSCSGGTMPSSPSLLNPLMAPGAGGGRLRTLDDPPPATGPAPTAPTPMAVIINIVGYSGSSAYMPNPTTANMGDSIVFMNADSRTHHIVLDDGTDLGEVLPGASSAPMPLTTPTATFHCKIHPTMVGAINGDLPPAAPYYPPPPDDYSGYY